VIEVRVETAELKKFLTNLQEGIPTLMQRINAAVGQVVFTFSQMWCPVRTGMLKKSGYAREEGQDFAIGYTAPYAPYVEWGTKHMRPRSFLRTAWIMTKGNMSGIVKRVITRYIEEAKG
jgi:HK97 gp10 family phage protein